MSVAILQPSIPAASFPYREQFHLAKKSLNETILEWYNRLVSMAGPCRFGMVASLIILDKFVFGLDEKYVRRFSQEVGDLTLEQLVKIVVHMDASSYRNQFETIVKSSVPSCGNETGNQQMDSVKAENVRCSCSVKRFCYFVFVPILILLNSISTNI